jgi:hypothetical protein
MKLARDIISNHYTNDRGVPTLFEHRGTIWYWRGRWWPRSRTWLLDTVRLALENAYIQRQTRDGPVTEPLLEKHCPPKTVAECIETITRVDEERAAPFWLQAGIRGEVTGGEFMITFRDRLVDVASGFNAPISPEWFDTVSLNAKYDETAQCPLWLKSLEEWSGGDEQWVTLLQRLFGYAIMPTRQYQKWFLFYGVPRSGKGTVLHTLRALMGNHAVNEVHHLDKGDGSRASAIVKQLVGQDPISVNIKYVRPLRNIESRALPILQSNEIPTLEDRAGGLSSKMVLVPFGVSFLNRENVDLGRQLRGELDGIARWALEGARGVQKWVIGDPGRFPMLQAAQDAVDDYVEAVNPFNRFLDEHFVAEERGWVASSVIWERWAAWVRGRRDRPSVNRHTFTRKLIEGCNWRLVRSRRGPSGDRGLAGLKMRYRPPAADGTD